MASASPVEKLQEEAVCPICLEFFTEPVSIDCGHNFCRACIHRHCETWGQESPGRPFRCPVCKGQFKDDNFRPNRVLANMVESILKLRAAGGEERAEPLCQHHQEKLKLFCEEDGKAICLVCRESQQHREHRVAPLEEAAQAHKARVQQALTLLREKMEAAKRLETKEARKVKEWQEKVQVQRQIIVSEFEKIRQFLSEEEQLLLEKLAKEEEGFMQRAWAILADLSEQCSALGKLITELEDKSRQSSVQLLEWARHSLSRAETARLWEPEARPTDVKTRYSFPEHCLEMRTMLQRFKTDVTLDPETAHMCLELSADRRGVRLREQQRAVPPHPKRFDTYRCVLGAAGLGAGRHYWEVEVEAGDKAYWTLGVARASLRRKGWFSLEQEEGVWAVRLLRGQYQALTCPETSLSPSRSPELLGVFLDWDRGSVTFYEAEGMEPIFSFATGAPFAEPLYPFFWLMCPGTSLRVRPSWDPRCEGGKQA
ncbi:E3 ubiquitin-protein ligase TRIM58-like [Pelodiscus sinensis]|uniref:E3 ubiquitin-protein ligase TRIM58-like n=1 Tax=Pelodiscus sinensis TaxID=13735 RepID=UPI003F6CF4C3